MKKIILYILSVALIFLIGACNEVEIFTEENSDVRIYMAQAVSSTSKAITVNRRAPLQSDSLFVFDVNAVFAGSGYPNAPGDIVVNFSLDYSKWDSINAVRVSDGLPAFEVIPDSVFSFGITQSVIRRGASLSDNIGFSIQGKKIEEGHNYMIPIGISDVNGGFPINTALAATFFELTVTPPVYPELNRSGWTIYDVDSEEANGEGPNNGRAIFALDGNLNTFWHTQWDGGEPPLPHHIAIDMNAANTLSGLYLTARQNAPNGAPRTVLVDVSTDGQTWESAGTYQLQAINARQAVFFSQTYTVRYFRVTVTATHGNTNITFFAEVSAF